MTRHEDIAPARLRSSAADAGDLEDAAAADGSARLRAILRLVLADRIAEDPRVAGAVVPDGPDHKFDRALVQLLFEAWLRLQPRSGAHEVERDGAVIDGIHHEIRIGGRRILLRARPVSRQLLYAFAGAPSHYLARNTIARVLWGTEYDPLRHECTLKSNIRRLRMLLAGFAELTSETGGYCMVLPDGVEFIPPVVTGQPLPGS